MKRYLIVFLLGIVATLAAWFGLTRVWPDMPGSSSLLDRAAVIKQMQSLNRLETASFTIEKIIETGTDYDQLRELLFGDKILLVAHGEVIAGFDMSTLDPEQIKGSGSSIRLTLPAPTVLSTSLDNSQTKVFDRKQGLLTKGDLNLEAQARGQAETAIRQAACDGDILAEANENGRKQIELLLRSAGFTDVTISLTQPSGCM